MSSEQPAGAFRAETFEMLARHEDANPWFRSRNRLIQWAMRSFFPAAADFLEVGCGNGYVLQGLRAAFPPLRLTGIEPGAAGLAIARSRVPGATLLDADARRLEYDAAFDVVSAFDVLEHLDDDESALASLFRATRPGGGLLLTVPQHAWLWSAADVRAGHFRRYARRDLIAKVERSGFKVLRVTSFVTLPLPALALVRLTGKGGTEDPEAEFRPRPVLDGVMALALGLERSVIAHGVSLPIGGSLLAVGRKR